MKQNIIAVDFDGTLCENKWPEIGMPNEELIEYLKKRQANGEKLILWTSRNEEQTDNARVRDQERLPECGHCKLRAAHQRVAAGC